MISVKAFPIFRSAGFLLSILAVLPAQANHSSFDHVHSSQDELLVTQGMASSSADTLWDLGATGSGIRILSIDTGVLSSHEELSGRVTCRADLHTTSDCSDGLTGNGHGTAIATIMGASSMNGVGITSAAPQVDGIDSIKFQLDNSSGSPIKHEIGLDLVNVQSNPAWWNSSAIITMSTNEDYTTTTQDTTDKNNICGAINGFLSAGKIVVLASGNDSKEIVPRVGLGTPTNYPSYCEVSHPNAAHDNKLLVVGGTTVAPFNTRWSSSSYGAVIDLYAPAESVYSAAKTGGASYGNFTGTSFAAPMVAGAAAQLLSCGVNADNVKQYLQDGSSVTITQPAGGNKKRLDVKGALQWAHQHNGSSVTVAPYLLNAFETGTTIALAADSKTITAIDTTSGVVIADLFTDTQLTDTASTANRSRCNRFTYSSSSALFNIDANGVLRFTGTADASTVITSTDFFGVATTKSISVVVDTNSAPTGLPVIDGTATENQTLTANTSSIADADGLGAFSYQWLRSGANITGANTSNYSPGNDDVGTTISLRITYVDGKGKLESLTSTPTSAIVNVNDAPTGLPTITGTAVENQTLSADTTGIADADGLGAFSYQWLRSGFNISAATATTYLLSNADVGATITLKVEYVDGHGSTESITSSATGLVININDTPTGIPTIIGDATENQTLSADTTGITDADGLGSFSYQWLRSEIVINGANTSNYFLENDDVGMTIKVQVSYIDNHGTLETLSSAATTAIVNINDAPTGLPTISGTAAENQTLSADVTGIADADGLGTFGYQWLRAGADISAATATTYLLGNDDVGSTISLRVSYTDAQGTAESLTSVATGLVINVNDTPTGLPTISGTATENQTLTANTTGIADADGLGVFSYQWLRAGADIGGATATTYLLGNDDVGSLINLRVSYTDNHGTLETLNSAATTAIVNVNDAPTGSPTISGTPTENQTLSADVTGIADADGLGTFGYQWLRAGADISAATATTYLLGNDDVGSTISLRVSYTDAQGTAESLTSVAAGLVINVNDTPTGLPTISGTATENQTLTANTTGIADADGLGVFSYQWLRAGADIGGAAATTYLLGNDDVGSVINLRVSYTDNHGTLETLNSAATTAIVNVNDAPTGSPTIIGTATEKQTLSADVTGIADADGLGSFSYQWLRNNNVIAGATGGNYVLVDDDVGSAVSLRVSYTDAHGTAESLTSIATGLVVNINDVPVGEPTISGTAQEGSTLIADTTAITDADGLGQLSLQWLRAGADITGASGSSYLLQVADVGFPISLRVSYTDGHGTVESVTSASTTVNFVDPDGDGITAYLDNCPNHSNTNQLDSDGDDRGDVCDPDDENDGIIDSPIQFTISQVSGINTTLGTQVFQNLGTVTIRAVLSDLDAEGGFIYNWNATDSDILNNAVINENELTFDPNSLIIPVTSKALVHTIDLATSESGSAIHNTILVTLKADSLSPLAFDCNDDQVIDINDSDDCDQDGVLNPADGTSDTDYDGIANYLDDDGLSAHQTAISLGAPAAANITVTQNNLSINLGPTARYSAGHSIMVDTLNIADVGGIRGTSVSNEIDTSHTAVDEPLRDIKIDGFARAGADGQIVISLQSALPSDAVYRHYQPTAGWQSFVIDVDNRLASAQGLAGLCPEPGSPAYSEGLNASDDCVQLTIRDGGANDADAEINGEIRNLGIIAISKNAPPTAPGGTSGGGSGGAFGMIDVLFLLFGLGCKLFNGKRLLRRWTCR